MVLALLFPFIFNFIIDDTSKGKSIFNNIPNQAAKRNVFCFLQVPKLNTRCTLLIIFINHTSFRRCLFLILKTINQIMFPSQSSREEKTFFPTISYHTRFSWCPHWSAHDRSWTVLPYINITARSQFLRDTPFSMYTECTHYIRGLVLAVLNGFHACFSDVRSQDKSIFAPRIVFYSEGTEHGRWKKSALTYVCRLMKANFSLVLRTYVLINLAIYATFHFKTVNAWNYLHLY